MYAIQMMSSVLSSSWSSVLSSVCLSAPRSKTRASSQRRCTALSPGGCALGKAAHEATLGHVQEVEVFEKIAANFEAAGYSDLTGLQEKLQQQGNKAAAEYPKLDRIIRAEVVG